MTVRLRVLMAAAIALHGALGRAQTATLSGHPRTGMLVGRAYTDTIPLAKALVTIAGTAHQVIAGEDGRFRIELPPGQHSVLVRALGREPWSRTIDLRAGESTFVLASLRPLPATALDPVVVRSAVSKLEGFEERRARGPGSFFTREEIRKMQPKVMTDILRRAPGVFLRNVGGGFGENITAMSSRTKPCPMAYIVNGSPMMLPNESTVDDYIVAHEVIAVEVYAGSSQIPTQFNSSAGNARCGVIVVWTKNGRAP
jgi:hypothetical protein